MDPRFDELPVYGLGAAEKTALLLDALHALTLHHATHCRPYARLLSAFGVDPASRPARLAEFLALTVRQFKLHRLKSIPDAEVFKTLLSSGTSGTPSTICLDREAAAKQSRVLVRIMQHWLGRQRLPMLIVDHPDVIRDRSRFSARGAGIQGMAMLGRDHTYALRPDMSFDREAVERFADLHGDGPVLVFGFTWMVWQYFADAMLDNCIRLPGAVLLHGGGWKRLTDRAVDNAAFRARLAEAGIARVHNYYGMVEQTGAIFVECGHGHLHAPVHSDVLVRDPVSGEPAPFGQVGIVELLSVLPTSYPGHVLLTDDLGVLHGVDDCPCGLPGAHFSVLGRIPRAEARGCSDTFEPETA
jgi:hypothetical protein